MAVTRRAFNGGLATTTALAGGFGLTATPIVSRSRIYRGPNVIIVRFGGGVRRLETIDAKATYAPFLRHTLVKRGVLIPNVTIAQLDGVNTSHAEGTLNILTGRYRGYRDAGSRVGADHLEPTEPTLFEYFRRTFNVPRHQALLINGEDRPQEEFFTYGVHRHYGIKYRSEMLSLHRFKLYKLQKILAGPSLTDQARIAAEKEFKKLRDLDYRGSGLRQSAKINAFWDRWMAHYGQTGLVNPRGDRLLTALGVRAVKELRPKLMMINYQDPDYVHWGNASHYTRAISVIDQGLLQLVAAVDADPEYRDNTVFVVVPDCGRDANPLMGIPFQHHFNSKSAHEIWALVFGPGIVNGKVLDKPVDQTALAPTLGAVMGFKTPASEGDVLEEVFV